MSVITSKMDKQNEKGKATIQLCSLPKSRRQKFFLICGTCNVVSIAENKPIEGKTGVKNNIGLEEEKRFIAVREAQNNGDKCIPHHVEKSWVDVSKDPIKSSEFQDVDKFQSLQKEKANDIGKGIRRYESTTKKVCWSDRDDHDDDSDEVDGQSSVHSFPGQEWSKLPQNVHEQNNPSTKETSLKLHGADESTCKNNEEARMQHANLTAKRVAWAADPSQSQAQLLGENTPSSPLPLTENSTHAGKKPSNTPEIKINDALVKPAWSENETRATSTSANRWKRLAPLKFKMNRIQGRRMERDAAIVHEEYEIMMENLKLYGVL